MGGGKDTDGDMTKIYGWHLLSAGIFQAPWSRTDAKRVFGCAGRTRGLGSVAPHRGRSTQQPPAGRTTPATVYKCALVNKGLMACPRILAGLHIVYWMAFQILMGNVDTQNRNVYLYSPLNSDIWYFIAWDKIGRAHV